MDTTSHQPQSQDPVTALPSFLAKLRLMLDDESTDSVFRWKSDHKRFVILNVDRFEEDLLSLHFHQNKYGVIKRCLELYGFIRYKNKNSLHKTWGHPKFHRRKP